MDFTAQSVSRHRDGRLVVTRYLDPDSIAHLVAPPASRITEVIQVHDLQVSTRHLILVNRLDYRSRRVRGVGDVVVFSEPCYAAFRAEKLQLATPAYYREQENLPGRIRDRHDGTLTKDATQWARTKAGPSARAELSFRSTPEPWVYCASHYHLNSELRDLKAEFAKYGYTAVTAIPDPDAFARWLGIAFALTLDKRNGVRLGALDDQIAADAPAAGRFVFGIFAALYPDIVLVHHGPVHYEDSSGRIATQEDFSDSNGGLKACFTKKTCFKFQSEYRFAVSTLGEPVKRKHWIRVSPELRELCRELLT